MRTAETSELSRPLVTARKLVFTVLANRPDIATRLAAGRSCAAIAISRSESQATAVFYSWSSRQRCFSDFSPCGLWDRDEVGPDRVSVPTGRRPPPAAYGLPKRRASVSESMSPTPLLVLRRSGNEDSTTQSGGPMSGVFGLCRTRCCICGQDMDYLLRYGGVACCCSKECFHEFQHREARAILNHSDPEKDVNFPPGTEVGSRG